MKKVLSLVLSICLMLTMCFASVAEAEDSVTINLWHRWSSSTEQALLNVIAGFEATHPNIHVEVTAKSGEYFALLQSMIADAAAGNDLPDVFVGGYNLLNYIATELKPTAIDQLAPSQEALDALYANFKPGMLELSQYDGVQVGLPYAVSIMPMYINMDLFTQAGLTEADIPTTWAEVAEVAAVITEKTGAIGMQIHNMEDAWGDQALVFSNGGQLLTEDKQRCDFTNEGALEAISMWQDMFKEIDAAGSDLITLHIHNNSGFTDDHNLPNDGVLDWPCIHDYLRESGYKGEFVLELYGGLSVESELDVLDRTDALYRG